MLYRTLFEVVLGESSIILGYDNSGDLLFNGMIVLMNGESSDVWKAVHITFKPATNATVHIDTEATILTSVGFPSSTSVDSVTVGNNFTGLIQDFRIYTPPLAMDGDQIIVPRDEPFLPQCLCPSGSEISLMDTCVNETNTTDTIDR